MLIAGLSWQPHPRRIQYVESVVIIAVAIKKAI
jgi:hypothetical protein